MRPTEKVPFRAAHLQKLKRSGAEVAFEIPEDILDREPDDIVHVDRPDWKTIDPDDYLHWDMNPFTGAVTSKNWAIQDLDRNRDYRLRVQGLLALSDCKAENGGFYCVPGAHRLIRKWAKCHVEDQVGNAMFM